LNLRPPGPELWKYQLQVLYLVSLREQHTSFSLAQLYRSCTEQSEVADSIAVSLGIRRSFYLSESLLPKWPHSYYNSNNTSEAAVVELKVRKFGNSLGVVLPKEVINRLHTRDGEPLFLIEASEGGYLLTPYDPGFEEKMAKAEDIISRYRNTLHVLAK
jgi:putative addiction module antidote